MYIEILIKKDFCGRDERQPVKHTYNFLVKPTSDIISLHKAWKKAKYIGKIIIGRRYRDKKKIDLWESWWWLYIYLEKYNLY